MTVATAPRRNVAPGSPSVAMLRSSTVAARRSDSTKVADAAPRDSASRPNAPEPAYRSSTARPVMSSRAVTMLNSDSRTRSVVGRGPRDGTAIRLPPATPPMIRVMNAARSGEHHQQIPALDLRGGRHRHPLHGGVGRRGDRSFHLHRLDGGDGLAGLDLVADGNPDGDDTGERCRDVVRVAPVRLLSGWNRGGNAAITHFHRSELTVDDAHHRSHRAFVRLGNRLEADQQLHTGLQLDAVLLVLPK